MQENYELVQKGFRILHPILAGYIGQELNREYHNEWWQEVLTTLGEKGRDLPDSGDYADLVDSMDIATCLRLIDWKWNVFRAKLSIDYRTWSKELMGMLIIRSPTTWVMKGIWNWPWCRRVSGRMC